jgi:hypothetical protein
MREQDQQIDPIEAELAELSDAERLGVFRATSTDRAWLAATDPAFTTHRPGWVGQVTRGRMAAVAALLAVAFGVWGLMFRHQLADLREQARLVPVRLVDSASVRFPAVLACLRGPISASGEGCPEGDLDGDGDVDLADYRALQVAYVSTSR